MVRPLEKATFQRHDHQGNKAANWTLQPTKPYLIVGDSNMGRLPLIHHSEVQVDAYPGAKFHHITHLFKQKTPASPGVKVLILSVGVNNREQNNQQRIDQGIRDLMEAADDTFPNARIWLASLNWSQQLPLLAIANLTKINTAIRKTERFIHPLPPGRFATESDNIHWTVTTGQEMWRFWKRLFDL